MSEEKLVNGVSVNQLVGTINAIKNKPDLASFTFRAGTRWVNGGHAQTTIQGFFGVGAEDTSRPGPFLLEGDEPSVLLGGNAGPNAVEAVLHALGSCLVVGFVYNAAAQAIRVESLTLSLEGDIDVHGLLGLSDRIRPGYDRIRVAHAVDCDATPEQLDALWAHVQKTSPVLDIIQKPVPVTIETAI